ncbi:MAG: RNA polymerase sigma factor [Peptococcaceae bacterium]
MEIPSLDTDDCLDVIVEKYSNMVYRLAFSLLRTKSDADDIYQEVFLRYIRKNPEFKSEEHRKAWLIRVTINCSKKFRTSSWIKKTVPLEESVLFETQEETNLYYELAKLPKKYRTVIHLFYYEDLSVNQISELLNIKPATIRTQLTRARSKLEKILKGEF